VAAPIVSQLCFGWRHEGEVGYVITGLNVAAPVVSLLCIGCPCCFSAVHWLPPLFLCCAPAGGVMQSRVKLHTSQSGCMAMGMVAEAGHRAYF